MMLRQAIMHSPICGSNITDFVQSIDAFESPYPLKVAGIVLLIHGLSQ
jgi:hypothetical protein